MYHTFLPCYSWNDKLYSRSSSNMNCLYQCIWYKSNSAVLSHRAIISSTAGASTCIFLPVYFKTFFKKINQWEACTCSISQACSAAWSPGVHCQEDHPCSFRTPQWHLPHEWCTARYRSHQKTTKKPPKKQGRHLIASWSEMVAMSSILHEDPLTQIKYHTHNYVFRDL